MHVSKRAMRAPRESEGPEVVLKWHYSTVKFFLLVVVPPAFVTAIGPEVAPVGTVAKMLPELSTWNFALTPLKVTWVAPMKWTPRIITFEPTLPRLGLKLTKKVLGGARPASKVKTTPLATSPC
jgi:hypothetical protein